MKPSDLRLPLTQYMGRASFTVGFAAIAVVANAASAQTSLTLAEAMARARAATPAARAVAAAADEASALVRASAAGYLPRIDVTQSVQRGNQPVYAFSSLLAQRRFTAADFDIGRLNDPAPLTNVRTALTLEQRVFDGGVTRLAVRGAELRRDLAVTDGARAGQDLALRAADAFVRVLQLEAADRAANGAVEAAGSDLDRARARRDVGLVTEADVLAVEVHLAGMRQQQIATAASLEVARIELREALGLPLDQPVSLVPPGGGVTASGAAALAAEAVASRPEGRQAALRVSLAENARRAAASAFLPTIGLEAGWDFNGAAWTQQRSGWLVGVTAQVNLFRGFADRARLAAARHGESRAGAEREQVSRRIEVEVRSAVARLEAARGREAVGRAALAQAVASQRIVRDRYEAGLATVTDVLRAAEAALEAESQAIAAEMDVILQTVALDRAAGRL